jgi:hypothetical protein
MDRISGIIYASTFGVFEYYRHDCIGSRNQGHQCNGGDEKGVLERGQRSESHCVLNTRWGLEEKLANGGDLYTCRGTKL